MTFTPTLAIGLGKAGCRMIEELQSVLEREGVADQAVLAGIDTKDDELERFLGPDGADLHPRQRLELRHPEDGGRQIKEERSYLYEGAELAPEGGATKERPIARYYLDSKNFERVRGSIEEWTDKLDDLTGNPGDINVWVLNALGGGSGSGTFPLITLSLHDQLRDEYGVRIRGVGSLPKADISNPDFDGKPPEEVIRDIQPGDSRHYLNTYLALRELEGLLNVDGEVTIPLESEPGNLQKLKPELKFERSPFDRYFLQRVDEGEEGERYYREMNETVANLVYFYGQVQEAEDFPEDVPSDRDSVLCSIDGCGAEFPSDRLRRYFDLNTDERMVKQKQRAVKRQREAFEKDERFLEDVLAVPKGGTPEQDSLVDEYLITQCRTHEQVGVNNFPLQNLTEATLDEQLATAARHLINEKFPSLEQQFTLTHLTDNDISRDEFDEIFEAGSADTWDRLRSFSAEAVVKYFYLDQFRNRMRTLVEEARRDLEQEVENLWAERRNEVQQHDPDLYKSVRDANLRRKHEALLEFYDNRISELRDEIENSWFTGSQEENKEQFNDELSSLRNKKSTYDSRQENENLIRQRRKLLRSEQLQQRRNDLEDAIEELQEAQDTYDRERGNLERRRREIADQLQQFDLERYSEWPLDRPDLVTPELHEQLDTNELTFAELDRQGVLDTEGDCTEFLKSICLERSHPEELSRVERNAEPYSILCALYHPSATDGEVSWESNLNHIRNSAGFSAFPEDKSVTIEDKLTIDLVTLYTNIQIENLVEHGFIHDQYVREDLSVGSVLTGESSEELENHMRFAYPELVDEPAPPKESLE